MIIYLDPNKRKNVIDGSDITWDELLQVAMDLKQEKSTFEGTYFAKDGKMIEWFDLPDHCPECLERLSYNEEFDSIYCESCDEWREVSCDDPTCEHCAERPEKPSEY